MTFFEDGIEIGEISDWKRTERFAEKKMVLGKELMGQKPKDLCEFVSPKAVKKNRKHWLITDDKKKITLSDVKIQHGTMISASIESEGK